MSLITELSPYIAVVGTGAAIFFAYRNHILATKNLEAREPAVATIDIRIVNPPPYSAQVHWTELTIRNVGQRTSGRLSVVGKCSWLELFDLHLHFPSENWVLQPNEEFRWKIRLPEAPTKPGFTIEVTAHDYRSGNTWTQKEITFPDPEQRNA